MSEDGSPRILALAHHFMAGHGGVPVSLLWSSQLLTQVGVCVDVLAEDGLHPNAGDLEELPSFCEIPRAIISPRYDALWIVGAWQTRALEMARKFRRAGRPVTYSPRGMLSRAEFSRLRDLKKFPYLWTLERRVLRLSDQVLLSSRLEYEQSPPLAAISDRVIRLPDPFMEDRHVNRTREADQRQGSARLLLVAEQAPRKGVAELVDAAIRLSAVELDVLGGIRPGSRRYVEAILRRIEAEGADNRIRFRGPQYGSAKWEFMRDADLVICPSHYESYGITILEALAVGTAVVASPHVGVLEWLSEAISAGWVKVAQSSQTSDLVTAISEALGATANTRRANSDPLEDLGLNALRSPSLGRLYRSALLNEAT